jgi:hypothetical protein
VFGYFTWCQPPNFLLRRITRLCFIHGRGRGGFPSICLLCTEISRASETTFRIVYECPLLIWPPASAALLFCCNAGLLPDYISFLNDLYHKHKSLWIAGSHLYFFVTSETKVLFLVNPNIFPYLLTKKFFNPLPF